MFIFNHIQNENDQIGWISTNLRQKTKKTLKGNLTVFEHKIEKDFFKCKKRFNLRLNLIKFKNNVNNHWNITIYKNSSLKEEFILSDIVHIDN